MLKSTLNLLEDSVPETLFESAVAQAAATTLSIDDSRSMVAKVYELTRKMEDDFARAGIRIRLKGELLRDVEMVHRRALVGLYTMVGVERDLAEQIVDTEIIGKSTSH